MPPRLIFIPKPSILLLLQASQHSSFLACNGGCPPVYCGLWDILVPAFFGMRRRIEGLNSVWAPIGFAPRVFARSLICALAAAGFFALPTACLAFARSLRFWMGNPPPGIAAPDFARLLRFPSENSRASISR